MPIRWSFYIASTALLEWRSAYPLLEDAAVEDLKKPLRTSRTNGSAMPIPNNTHRTEAYYFMSARSLAGSMTPPIWSHLWLKKSGPSTVRIENNSSFGDDEADPNPIQLEKLAPSPNQSPVLKHPSAVAGINHSEVRKVMLISIILVASSFGSPVQVQICRLSKAVIDMILGSMVLEWKGLQIVDYNFPSHKTRSLPSTSRSKTIKDCNT